MQNFQKSLSEVSFSAVREANKRDKRLYDCEFQLTCIYANFIYFFVYIFFSYTGAITPKFLYLFHQRYAHAPVLNTLIIAAV